MKFYLIFITVFLTVIPYTINQSAFHENPVMMHVLQQSEPCPQKSPNTVSQPCTANTPYVVLDFLTLPANLLVHMSLIMFFIALAACCSGFETPIFKPPK